MRVGQLDLLAPFAMYNTLRHISKLATVLSERFYFCSHKSKQTYESILIYIYGRFEV